MARSRSSSAESQAWLHAWRILERFPVDQYGHSVAKLCELVKGIFKFLGVSTDMMEKNCFAIPWVKLQRLLYESQSSSLSSARRRMHGTSNVDMYSWRFSEGSSTSAILRRQRLQCIQLFFSKTLFDFKKSISGLIELKFSGKTPNEVLYAPIYFWGVYF